MRAGELFGALREPRFRLLWLGQATSRSDEMTLAFREPYLRRLRRVSDERHNLPSQSSEGFFWHVDRELTLFKDGHR